jgi:xanthine dehydrogenase small subunit
MSEYIRPGSLPEALEARAKNPDFTVLAGGTDLFVAANTKPAPVGLLDLFNLHGLRGISQGTAGSLLIGAATTYSDLIASAEVADHLPILVDASREVGALQVQSRGTIGGNMATSSPVGDTLPVLLAADAVVHVASVRGERRIPYGEFLTGYRQVDLAGDELLVAVEIPKQVAGAAMTWRKVGTRKAQSISKVMMAAIAGLDDGRISHVRIALGAVADRTIRARKAEDLVVGKKPSAELAEAVRHAVTGEIKPITDVRSSADYRLESAANIAARFISDLA